jgi:hypothetical protein
MGICRKTVHVPTALGWTRAGQRQGWAPDSTCQSLPPDEGAGDPDGETDKRWLCHCPKTGWKLTQAAYCLKALGPNEFAW